MAFDFLKKIFKGKEEVKTQTHTEENDSPNLTSSVLPKEEPVKEEKNEAVSSAAETSKTKPVSQMTDEELEKELLAKAPELFSQAKTPEMKKMVIDIYRAMLLDNVNVDNEKEVKKWIQKHPEVAQGGSPMPKPETYKREAPKVGRNDPCPCGSGKKYKKCCGKE